MDEKHEQKNPFYEDKPATATHLSTWSEKSRGNTFLWIKDKYKILSDYYDGKNEVHVKIFYDDKIIKETTEIMYIQTPSIEDICRTTQRILTEYLNEW